MAYYPGSWFSIQAVWFFVKGQNSCKFTPSLHSPPRTCTSCCVRSQMAPLAVSMLKKEGNTQLLLSLGYKPDLDCFIPTGRLKLTGFETYGVALGILALRIFRLGTLRGRSHLPSREPVVRLPGSGRWHGVTGALYCKAGVRSVR